MKKVQRLTLEVGCRANYRPKCHPPLHAICVKDEDIVYSDNYVLKYPEKGGSKG